MEKDNAFRNLLDRFFLGLSPGVGVLLPRIVFSSSLPPYTAPLSLSSAAVPLERGEGFLLDSAGVGVLLPDEVGGLTVDWLPSVALWNEELESFLACIGLVSCGADGVLRSERALSLRLFISGRCDCVGCCCCAEEGTVGRI